MDDQTENSVSEILENEGGEILVAEDIPAENPNEEVVPASIDEPAAPDEENSEADAAPDVEENLITEGVDDETALLDLDDSIDLVQLLEAVETTVDDEFDEEEVKVEPEEEEIKEEPEEPEEPKEPEEPEEPSINFDFEETVSIDESIDIKTEYESPDESYSKPEEEITSPGNQNGDQRVSISKPSDPKYQIKEFIESASKLKFEVVNTNTTFKLFLPTLKKIIEIPEWQKVKLKREQPEIRLALQKARERSREYLVEMSKRDNRMIVSEVVHILNYEKAQRMKAKLLERNRGIFKDLTEPPQRCDPRQSFGIKKRPTEYPPMPTLNVSTRPKDNTSGARLRCARDRYNKRSDDTWLRSEQLKLIKAAKRLERCRMLNEKLATPPQEHDPWARSPKIRKERPSIPIQLHRH